MTIERQARNEGYLLLKLVLVLELPVLDHCDHLVEHAYNIDGLICVAHPGVLDIAEGRVKLAELLEVFDSRNAGSRIEGDG